MSKVKYQIFISSTYDDLKEERDQVIKSILEMGHIPVGMEMFSAADEEQWKIITRQIDDSDYYVVIVANRYGSMVDGISFTEKEYNYALKKKVPALGFLLDPKASWPSDRMERVEENRQKLDAFKEKVRKKPVNFWLNKDDLHAKCAIALTKTFNTQPRPGWIRTPSVSTRPPQVIQRHETTNVYNRADNPSEERLTSENERLRLENFRLKNEPLLVSQPKHKEKVTRIIYAEGFVEDLNADIWPIIRTVSGSTYWVQSRADIDHYGRWKAKVIVGQEGNSDVGARYQLGVFVNPKMALNEGDELIKWPDAEHNSEPIEIIRN